MNAIITTLIGVVAGWASLFLAFAAGISVEAGRIDHFRSFILMAVICSWVSILLLLVRS